jgi:hypothetical protein
MKPTDNQKKAPAASTKFKAKGANAKIPGTVPVRFSAIIFNLIGAVVSVMFLTAFFSHHEPDPSNPGETHLNSGYDWLLNSMLANNLKVIEENPDKTTQQRYELKWGQGEISYVDKIRQATPDTAIILLPPRKIMKDVGFKSVVDLPWITYFLYPRTIVYEDDSIRSPLYARASYLVSINGWGLDKANYRGVKPEAFMVLPIKK